MKKAAIIFILYHFCIASCFCQRENLVTLPLKVADGIGSFYLAAQPVGKRLPPENKFSRIQQTLKGVPTGWTNPLEEQAVLNWYQFAYQNYKLGKLDSSFFAESKREYWTSDMFEYPLSDTPIKCYTHIIAGKNKAGELRARVDTNNDLDFSNEVDLVPALLTSNIDSLVQAAPLVHYQGFRNGKIVELTVPILLFLMQGRLMYSFAQHGEAIIDGVKILVCPDSFTSASYSNSSSLCLDKKGRAAQDQIFKVKNIFSIGKRRFRFMGADINRGKLFLDEILSDSVFAGTQVGYRARPFNLQEFLTREKLSLESYKGKFLLLDFWGTWCSPCRAELPNLKNAYEKLDKSKIEFLGVANDDEENLRNFLMKEPLPWKQVCTANGSAVILDYEVQGYPTNFLIDPAGKIIAVNLRGENLLEELRKFVK